MKAQLASIKSTRSTLHIKVTTKRSNTFHPSNSNRMNVPWASDLLHLCLSWWSKLSINPLRSNKKCITNSMNKFWYSSIIYSSPKTSTLISLLLSTQCFIIRTLIWHICDLFASLRSIQCLYLLPMTILLYGFRRLWI